ncbi:DegT/DnrJ/EryC1/StrS family aminotransferase [Saccharopolyspora oryzae]|uniref:DegT/DnrJ/EryC1/StrS family aminotransferase n=1 Tax=Saccharopolyspora oryzae TaxID=2997343 RepID=A0ABT4UR45_9PSEU|nr:DegT/DnrJ/EryC1/StrS family aminotransferase [Saccharopolyspora oryzae]MDA3624190.1 DegT/DnrJ/EryC1/StrS family aminotransferase [Saccharopolyspora oryzae]
MSVPFLDLKAVHHELRDELDLAWKSVVQHGHFLGGPEVERFEDEFAAYCETSKCVGVGNGTDALELILLAIGVGPGDEVVVPANTFAATAEAVRAVGARPRFADVLPDTLLLDPDSAAAAINWRTAALIGVHLFGQLADVSRLEALAARHGLAFIEDAAQAHGARLDGRRAGSAGHAAAFSFYPGKNLGALGDGGAVVTDDPALADRVRQLANHGRSARDRNCHEVSGRNSRLDTLQAAVLLAKLSRLDRDNDRRRSVMARYRAWLPDWCTPVAVAPGAAPVHHLAVVRTADRERVAETLTAAQIGWGVHYPVPCHLQPAFEEFGERLPVAERAAGEILSLPMSPSLSDGEVARVCEVLRGART